MKLRLNSDVLLGLAMVALGLFIALYWAQVDSDTGLAEKVRGRWSIGDALAPTVAGVLIALAGLGVAISGLAQEAAETGLNRSSVIFLVLFLTIITFSFMVLRYSGPVIADLFGQDYRVLRDERPWKCIGFVLGGGGMVASLICLSYGRVTPRAIFIGFAVALVLALIYDLPFEDLLPPPNGDV